MKKGIGESEVRVAEPVCVITMQEANKPPSVRRRTTTTARPSSDVAPSVVPRLVAGSIGSIVTALAVTPLEVVKVRQQQAILPASTTTTLPPNVVRCPKGCGTFVLNILGSDCVLPKSAVPFFDKQGHYRDSVMTKSGKNLGTFAMLRRIFAQEGVSGIYAGLSPTLVMSVPNTVLYFTSYDEIVGRLRRRLRSDDASWVPLVSGASARLIASTATAPLELIRTRQASLLGESKIAPGLWGEFRIIVQTEGAGALFTGLSPTLWRDVPFSAIYWFCLEQFKLLWKRHDGDSDVSHAKAAGEAFVNGATSGMIASFATTPFDVVKTRRQTGESALINNVANAQEVVCHHNGSAVYEPPVVPRAQPMGTLGTMKQIVETEGISGLWRGNQTRMIKVAPACAIMISCYELGKRVME